MSCQIQLGCRNNGVSGAYRTNKNKDKKNSQPYLKRLPRFIDRIPIVGHLQNVTDHILPRNVPRTEVHIARFQARPDSFSLADGVEPQTTVLSDGLAGFAVDDRPRCLPEVMPQKVVELQLAQEADALMMANVGRGRCRRRIQQAEESKMTGNIRRNRQEM